MNKLFIHTPIFRFLSPIFSGVVAYLLILLINNNIGQLQDEFLSQELYVCIVLSYIVHEFSRLLLWVFKKIPLFLGTIFTLIIQIVFCLLLSAGIITCIFSLYYKYVSGFSPSTEELFTFNSIYCTIPIVFVLLDVSHQYLYKINTSKLENELLIKQNIEEEFKQFKKEVNPNLLFESLEVLLILIKEDTHKVDDFIDHLASIYRYILSSKKSQLVSVSEEINVLNELIAIYNYLPYKKIKVVIEENLDFLIVPGTLLYIIEQIIKTTIVSTNVDLAIKIAKNDANFTFSYLKEDKITAFFTIRNIEDLIGVYSIYSEESIQLIEEKGVRTISIPILKIKA